MLYLIIIACIVPACITMFAYHNRRKRGFETLNSRETLSYSLQHEDEYYSVKRSKSALKKSNSCKSTNSRKSVQFNEVVLEVFDLINDDEQDNVISFKPSCPKIVKSTLKNEKVYVPIRCSNTIFPKTIINEYNGEIINFEDKKDKQEETKEEVKESESNGKEFPEFPEILIIKENGDNSSTVLSHNSDNVTLTETSVSEQISNVAKTVITSEAKSESNLININTNVSQKSNTLPRRARPNFKGHKRQSSVRLTCIY